MHVAIILDGNGRWATRRGLPRTAGHRRGVEAVRRAVEAAPALGIDVLTVYAFSSDNWKRPPAEVATLMGLLRHFLARETGRCVKNGVRLKAIGRRDRLSEATRRSLDEAEQATAGGRRLEFRIAFDYSSRDMIAEAVREGATSREALSLRLGPDVDLLIRTAGEQRLSDFLLWECAYAELYFTQRLWPDFTPADLEAAIADFHSRTRRFGGLPLAEQPIPA